MKRARWTRLMIRTVRAEIRAELEAVAAAAGPNQRLAHALRKARKYQDDLTSLGILRCFTYVFSALVHHSRFGGLKAAEIDRMAELAGSLLTLQGVPAIESAFSYLHAEVHNIMGQIRRGQGRHWEAAWHGHLMSYHTPRDAAGLHPSEHQLVLGNRALRLGQAEVARLAFSTAAIDPTFPPSRRPAALLGEAKALRLAGKLTAARAALAAIDIATFGIEAVGELRWEEACITVQETGELDAFAVLVSGSATQTNVSYKLEASLWSRASARAHDSRFAISIPGIKRKLPETAREYRSFIRGCALIEGLYDTEIPFHRRLAQIGSLQKIAAAQVSVDKELLLVAAAARWLHRFGPVGMATMVRNCYSALSLALTDGTMPDVLDVRPPV